MYALCRQRESARCKAQRPPSPPAHRPPPPTHPSTQHTDSRPPTPLGLRAFGRHRGPARHRGPDKNVYPNGRHNDTSHNTTQPKRSDITGRRLPAAELCPAPRVRRQYAPNPNKPLATHTRKWAQPRAPHATRLHNPKHHRARPHTAVAREAALHAHLHQVPLNYRSETVVQPSSTAHFHYGFPTVEPLSWYSNKLLSSNLKTAIFSPAGDATPPKTECF